MISELDFPEVKYNIDTNTYKNIPAKVKLSLIVGKFTQRK